MPDLISIEPAPFVKARFVDDQVPLMIIVPPLVMSRLLAATDELTLVTFNRFVPLETHCNVPDEIFPISRVPYNTLSVVILLSTVQMPLMIKSSAAAGLVPPLHFEESLKFPGPVNVLIAADTSVRINKAKNDKSK